jgi:hypothetical protein
MLFLYLAYEKGLRRAKQKSHFTKPKDHIHHKIKKRTQRRKKHACAPISKYAIILRHNFVDRMIDFLYYAWSFSSRIRRPARQAEAGRAMHIPAASPQGLC